MLLAVILIGVAVFSVLYVVQSVFFPHTYTISSTSTHTVFGGNYTYPGFYSLELTDLKQGDTWEIKVSVTGGTVGTTFCVLSDGPYETWASSYYFTKGPGLTFPWDQCVDSSGSTLQATLTFKVPSSGTWDIVAINTNPNIVTVTYSPAF